jgi:hypothetical protein
MHGYSPAAEKVASEIGGKFCPSRDKIVPQRGFGKAARARWPEKAAYEIALICNCDERQAKRYLSGEYSIPYVLARSMLDWMHGLA